MNPGRSLKKASRFVGSALPIHTKRFQETSTMQFDFVLICDNYTCPSHRITFPPPHQAASTPVHQKSNPIHSFNSGWLIFSSKARWWHQDLHSYASFPQPLWCYYLLALLLPPILFQPQQQLLPSSRFLPAAEPLFPQDTIPWDTRLHHWEKTIWNSMDRWIPILDDSWPVFDSENDLRPSRNNGSKLYESPNRDNPWGYYGPCKIWLSFA